MTVYTLCVRSNMWKKWTRYKCTSSTKVKIVLFTFPETQGHLTEVIFLIFPNCSCNWFLFCGKSTQNYSKYILCWKLCNPMYCCCLLTDHIGFSLTHFCFSLRSNILPLSLSNSSKMYIYCVFFGIKMKTRMQTEN